LEFSKKASEDASTTKTTTVETTAALADPKGAKKTNEKTDSKAKANVPQLDGVYDEDDDDIEILEAGMSRLRPDTGEFQGQADAEWIVIRESLRGHNALRADNLRPAYRPPGG
jgi:hypothetical protein